jgi:hypothetical protein
MIILDMIDWVSSGRHHDNQHKRLLESDNQHKRLASNTQHKRLASDNQLK